MYVILPLIHFISTLPLMPLCLLCRWDHTLATLPLRLHTRASHNCILCLQLSPRMHSHSLRNHHCIQHSNHRTILLSPRQCLVVFTIHLLPLMKWNT